MRDDDCDALDLIEKLMLTCVSDGILQKCPGNPDRQPGLRDSFVLAFLLKR